MGDSALENSSTSRQGYELGWFTVRTKPKQQNKIGWWFLKLHGLALFNSNSILLRFDTGV